MAGDRGLAIVIIGLIGATFFWKSSHHLGPSPVPVQSSAVAIFGPASNTAATAQRISASSLGRSPLDFLSLETGAMTSHEEDLQESPLDDGASLLDRPEGLELLPAGSDIR